MNTNCSSLSGCKSPSLGTLPTQGPVLEEGITARTSIHCPLPESEMNGTVEEQHRDLQPDERNGVAVDQYMQQDDDLVDLSDRGCSIACEGLVVPYFEQCVQEPGSRVGD